MDKRDIVGHIGSVIVGIAVFCLCILKIQAFLLFFILEVIGCVMSSISSYKKATPAFILTTVLSILFGIGIFLL